MAEHGYVMGAVNRHALKKSMALEQRKALRLRSNAT